MEENKNTKSTRRKPITIEQLKVLSQGILIDIPDYEGDGTIPVQVKRIDFSKEFLKDKLNLSTLLTKDIIDKLENSELSQEEREKEVAKDIIKEGKQNEITDLMPMVDDICRECLVKPTFEEFESVYPLTFQQKYFLFNWVIEGVKALKPFRTK